MSKLYFAAADVHSFYSEWVEALTTAGFNFNNPDHIVIVCGDLFDRGSETKQCYELAKQLAGQNRLIYVRGNHEDLLMSCLAEVDSIHRVSGHHIYNGTVQTIADIADVTVNDVMFKTFSRANFASKMIPFIDFINNNTVDYFELGSTVFVHGWLPTDAASDTDKTLTCLPDWRSGNWTQARWDNGLDMWHFGLIPEDVTRVVCGHWHCSYGWSILDHKYKEFPAKTHPDFAYSFTPFIKSSLVALDACTAYSNKVNVCVFEERGNLIKSVHGTTII